MKGIKNGEKVWWNRPGARLEAVAVVTIRLRPFKIQGNTVHQVGLPWHYRVGPSQRTAVIRPTC